MSTAAVQVRIAEKADTGAVVNLLALNQLPVADISESVMGDFLIIAENSNLIGVVALQIYGDTGLLRSLSVETTNRGRGLGGQLIAAALSRAQQNRLKQVFLLTETAESFFKARGFQRCDRNAAPQEITETPEFNLICPASAVCMKKDI